MKRMKKEFDNGITVVHADPLGPRGKGVVISGDQYSIRVKWDSGKIGIYHPRILIKVKE